jgi:hypothetical protein
MKKIFLILLSSFFSSCLFAAPIALTGEQLLENCQVTLDIHDKNFMAVRTESEFIQGAKSGICQGYLMSVNEVRQFARHRYCLPEQLNMLEAAAVIVKYLKAHPKDLSAPASSLVMNAYQAYFPCRA